MRLAGGNAATGLRIATQAGKLGCRALLGSHGRQAAERPTMAAERPATAAERLAAAAERPATAAERPATAAERPTAESHLSPVRAISQF